MTAPILPLNARNLASHTNVGIVRAWMLFPDDGRWRERTIANATVRDGLERLQTARAVRQDQLQGLVMLALNAAAPNDLQEQFDKRAPRGYGAGMILYNSGLRIPRGDKQPVSVAMREVERTIWGKSHSNSKYVNEVIWKIFRPVAALWAAYIHNDKAGDDGTPVEFPCNADDLPQFLALSENMRQRAETTRPPRQADPLLKPGISVRLPDEVLALLPAGTLTIGQVSAAADGSCKDRK